MSVNTEARLTRAQAEGVLYKLPDSEQGKAFKERVCSLYHEPAVLLEVLHLTQESFGCLPKSVLGWIAQEFKIPRSDVYSAATFYSIFSLKPGAKYVIRVCDCLPCYLQGGQTVLDAIRDAADIPTGEMSSEDGQFSLQTVSCLGLCDQAPAMMINEERYGCLTEEKVRWLISSLSGKEHAEEGSKQ